MNEKKVVTKRDLVEDTKIIRKAEHQESEKAAASEITEVPVGARLLQHQ